VDDDFDVFYARTVRPMISWTRPLMPRQGPASAEDLVQEAFAAAWKNWRLVRTLHEAQRVKWMHTTLIRLSAAIWERQKQWRDIAPLLSDSDRAQAPEPEDAAMAAVSAAVCLRVLTSMTPIERHVSVLCWVLGYNGAEVARLLEENEATIRGAKKRARDKLLSQVGTDAITYWLPDRATTEGGTAR
jgi:RNA polymerase sigma-70 factor (ECF subfamily)